MKRNITKGEQSYINSLLNKRMEREKQKLFSKEQDKDRMWMYDEENYIHKDGSRSLDNQIESFRFHKK